MNVKRFIGRHTKEAMQKVRQIFGENAVVLSTKPCAEGIEIVAMAPESVLALETLDAPVAEAPVQPAAAPAVPRRAAASAPPRGERGAGFGRDERVEPGFAPAPRADDAVQADVSTLAMSTLSFQDYVRERMLKKRQAALRAAEAALPPVPVSAEVLEARLSQRPVGDGLADAAALRRAAQAASAPALHDDADAAERAARAATQYALGAQGSDDGQVVPLHRAAAPARPAAFETPGASVGRAELSARAGRADAPARREPPAAIRLADAPAVAEEAPAARQERAEMMNELRSMKGLIEERFGALAFMEKLQRSPAQARLTHKLLDCGFSPALVRKLIEGVPADVVDENAWAAGVLEHNLATGDAEGFIEDRGGVYALVGATGVGKTTTTAKIAAAFATRHGAGNLGLITLDAYRVGAHEQLRAYGRILGVPVHTAHDRAALEDLLELLASKRMVLIDTAGVAQRDSRTRELLEMLSHRAIGKIVVVNAASQGESIEDVLISYRAATAKGIVLSKLDEAVKLGPALDALIRHRLKVLGVANGQRVPEDWHHLSSNALVHRAMRGGGTPAWRMDANDVNLVFAAGAAPGTVAAVADAARGAAAH